MLSILSFTANISDCQVTVIFSIDKLKKKYNSFIYQEMNPTNDSADTVSLYMSSILCNLSSNLRKALNIYVIIPCFRTQNLKCYLIPKITWTRSKELVPHMSLKLQVSRKSDICI